MTKYQEWLDEFPDVKPFTKEEYQKIAELCKKLKERQKASKDGRNNNKKIIRKIRIRDVG